MDKVDKTSSGRGSDGTISPNPENLDTLRWESEELETLRLDTEKVEASEEKTEPLMVGGGVPSTSRTSTLEAGKRFGSYNLIQLLGEGGFGQVWEAESLETGRRVALKLLTALPAASPDAVERFKREGRLAASLNHPNCVYIFGAEEVESYPAITMELMPGGTLQQRLEKSGPLPVQQAVDYMLDIIDGLEAAQKAGIIHRDVKPSNCFLDAVGKVRIGDFGLSKTLEADTKITVTGAYLGTPSYSSPEQVRGRDVDFRSDLYAVGATLYTLLTGKPPFEGKQAGEVLARIVAEEPTPFSEHKVEVPRGLQRVILRCLAKDREKRYPSYAALRAALTPYSSEALTTGSLGKRFAAILVDITLLTIVSWPLFQEATTDVGFSSITFLLLLLSNTLYILYFFILEKLWGRSVGKFLFGLRVTSTSGSGLNTKQAFLRSFVFVAFWQLLSALAYPIFGSAVFNPTMISLLFTLISFVPVFTMRKSNSYAGIHELASHTRVMAMKKRVRYEASAPEVKRTELETGEGIRRAFGPYRAVGVIWESDSEALILGHDDALGRDVWIHWTRDDSQLRPISEIASSRPGRLRWLQGSRKTGDRWDAYEAPSGTRLIDWVRSHGRLSWAQMRGVLLGLSRELEAGMEQGDLPQELSLRSIWVDAHGQPKLLDFLTPDGRVEAMAIAPEKWREFLHQVALLGLEGQIVAFESLNDRVPRVPLPEYTRSLMARLCRKDGGFEKPAELTEALEAVSSEPVEVSRRQRIGPLVTMVSLPLSFCMLFFLIIWSEPNWARDVEHWDEMFRLLDQAEQGGHQESERKRKAIEKLFAYSYMRYEENKDGFWVNKGLQDDIAKLSQGQLQMIRTLATQNRLVTDREAKEARKTLYTLTGDSAFDTSLFTLLKEFVLFGFIASSAFLLFISLPAVVCSFIFSGGLLPFLFGIAVQRKDGRRASRLRCFVRALVAWSSFLIPLVILLHCWYTSDTRLTTSRGVGRLLASCINRSIPGGAQWIVPLLCLIIIAGTIYSIIKPERGIQDLIVGTHLVPR